MGWAGRAVRQGQGQEAGGHGAGMFVWADGRWAGARSPGSPQGVGLGVRFGRDGGRRRGCLLRWAGSGAGVEVVFVMGEGLPDGEGEGEDEVVVFGLGAVAAEVGEFVDQVRQAGGVGG